MGYERSCNTRNESPPHARGFQASLKTFGQPREPAHRHRHCEVLSLDVARRNMVAVGIATDNSRPWFPCTELANIAFANLRARLATPDDSVAC